MHIIKNFQNTAQSSGRVKIFFCSGQQQVRVAVKKIRGNVAQDPEDEGSHCDLSKRWEPLVR
jgi:hypothetical protein